MTITLMKEWSHFHPSNPSRNQSTQLLVSHTAMTRVPHPMACAVKQRLQATVSRQISTENATVEQTKIGRKTSSLFFSPLLFLFLFLSISLSLSLPSSSLSPSSYSSTSLASLHFCQPVHASWSTWQLSYGYTCALCYLLFRAGEGRV